MIKIIALFLLTSCVTFAQTNQTTTAAAHPSAPAKHAKAGKSKNSAFHGKLESMDRTTMTITVSGKDKPRIIGITSKTRITKAGKPGTLSDAVVGGQVSGQAVKTADGKEQATSLNFSDSAAQGVSKPAKTPAK